MSNDDLVKRLRDPAFGTETTERNLMDKAADRIEELEAKGLANKVAIMRLEAKLAKALEFIQDLTGCEWPYDAHAKRILAELTGGKDE